MLWLDDIGLSQYRETFAEQLIDGQMLLRLTAQDLFDMRIQSAVHHASLARAVQFLQSVDFCFHRLEKRFDAVSWPQLFSRHMPYTLDTAAEVSDSQRSGEVVAYLRGPMAQEH